MVATIAILAALLGLALTIIGLRGRRIDDHPLCRRCGFDLTGKPAGSEMCSECGASLSARRAVAVGHRNCRTRDIWFGIAIIFFAVLPPAVTMYLQARSDGWIKWAPAYYLTYEAASSDSSRRTPAVAELLYRFNHEQLSRSALNHVIDIGLGYQADVQKPWDFAWGDLLQLVQTKGVLTDQQWRQYIEQATGHTLTLEIRPRVRRGDPTPYRVTSTERRAARDFHFGAEVIDAALTRSDGSLLTHRWEVLPSFNAGHSPMGAPLLLNADVSKVMTDGPQTLHLRGSYHISADGDPARVLATLSFDTSASFEVLPASGSTVKIVHNPAVADRVRRALTVQVRTGMEPSRRALVDVHVENPPIGIGFQVLLGSGGKQESIYTFNCAAATTGFFWRMPAADPIPVGTKVDLLFRFDPDAVAAAARTVDQTDVWDGDIDFNDFVVQPFFRVHHEPGAVGRNAKSLGYPVTLPSR